MQERHTAIILNLCIFSGPLARCFARTLPKTTGGIAVCQWPWKVGGVFVAFRAQLLRLVTITGMRFRGSF